MVAVAIFAATLRLGDVAWRVWSSTDLWISHLWCDGATGVFSIHAHAQQQTFWSRYRRALLGQPWPGDFRCDCRSNPYPGRLELASAADINDLLPLYNNLFMPSSMASEHRHSAMLLAGGIAGDEAAIIAFRKRVSEYASKGVVVHGADGVCQSIRENIANNRRQLLHHEQMIRKYEAAARRPWLPVAPDLPGPR